MTKEISDKAELFYRVAISKDNKKVLIQLIPLDTNKTEEIIIDRDKMQASYELVTPEEALMHAVFLESRVGDGYRVGSMKIKLEYQKNKK